MSGECRVCGGVGVLEVAATLDGPTRFTPCGHCRNREDVHLAPDLINHPAHYTNLRCMATVDGERRMVEVECKDIVRALGLGYAAGQAFAYIWRAGRKDGEPAHKDLRKAAFWCTDEAEALAPTAQEGAERRRPAQSPYPAPDLAAQGNSGAPAGITEAELAELERDEAQTAKTGWKVSAEEGMRENRSLRNCAEKATTELAVLRACERPAAELAEARQRLAEQEDDRK